MWRGTYTWNKMAIKGMTISQTSRRRSALSFPEGPVSSRSVYSLIDCRMGDGWAAHYHREVSRASRFWEPAGELHPDRHRSDRLPEGVPWVSVWVLVELRRLWLVSRQDWVGR